MMMMMMMMMMILFKLSICYLLIGLKFDMDFVAVKKIENACL